MEKKTLDSVSVSRLLMKLTIRSLLEFSTKIGWDESREGRDVHMREAQEEKRSDADDPIAIQMNIYSTVHALDDIWR